MRKLLDRLLEWTRPLPAHRPPRAPVAAPRGPRPLPQVIDAPVCASCAFYDTSGRLAEYVPLCAAVKFARDPITGAPDLDTEISCEAARSTILCGPEGARFLARRPRP